MPANSKILNSGIKIRTELATIIVVTNITVETKIRLNSEMFPDEIDSPMIRFIPKDISMPTIVEIIITKEAIEEATPTGSAPPIRAAMNQNMYVNIEGIIMLTEAYQIFLLTFESTVTSSP